MPGLAEPFFECLSFSYLSSSHGEFEGGILSLPLTERSGDGREELLLGLGALERTRQNQKRN